jgi:NAD(P)-dependent dehydrogenase (short-subunit alcohol dehydrogenase family)
MKTLNELFSLKGQHIIVSGCGLLGSHFAEALLVANAKVSLLDINKENLKIASNHLNKNYKGKLKTYCCDITSKETLKDTIKSIESDYPIYGLINTAAIDPKTDPKNTSSVPGDFLEYPVESWRLSMEVNVTGSFLLTQEVSRYLSKRGEGSIVNISSTYGIVGPDQKLYEEGVPDKSFKKPGDYPTSKAAIIGFTKYLAAYFANTKIRVNCLVPGGVFNNHSQAFVKAYSSRTLMGRMGNPNDYSGAVIYLLSNASSYVTGTSLVVDGGWTAI